MNFLLCAFLADQPDSVFRAWDEENPTEVKITISGCINRIYPWTPLERFKCKTKAEFVDLYVQPSLWHEVVKYADYDILDAGFEAE